MKRSSFTGLRYAVSGDIRPQNTKYRLCQFGSFLRRATSPLSLPALPYPAPVFSARASSATVADAVISLSNVTFRSCACRRRWSESADWRDHWRRVGVVDVCQNVASASAGGRPLGRASEVGVGSGWHRPETNEE
jgi:hypothetical protein